MIEARTYSERADAGRGDTAWLPGLLLTDDRCADWHRQPYAKVTKWHTPGRPTWAALVHSHGHSIRLVSESRTAREMFKWAARQLRTAITGGRSKTSTLYRAAVAQREEEPCIHRGAPIDSDGRGHEDGCSYGPEEG
jgi:hypothetical protein